MLHPKTRLFRNVVVSFFVTWFLLILYVSYEHSFRETNAAEEEMNKLTFGDQRLLKQAHLLREIDELLRRSEMQGTNNSISTYDEKFLRKLQMKLKVCLQRSSSSNASRKEDKTIETSIEHEVLVKRIKNDLVEMGYNLERELNSLKKNPNNSSVKIDILISRLAEEQQAALIDVEDLNSLNNDWRRNEAKELQALIQSRIRYIQNPKNCSLTRQLHCKLEYPCGLGCQIHYVAYCFLVAYGTQRTMIINSHNWRYNPEGWETVFQPVSETCVKPVKSSGIWKGEKSDSQALEFNYLASWRHVKNYQPLSIPKDIGARLIRLHGNPSAWWVGQFMRYLMRPKAWLQRDIDAIEAAIGFQQPVVGIHVRRTDKIGTEAAFHGIEEYMKHVIAWYDKLDLRLSKKKGKKKAVRRVYLASDDPSVLPEARKKYEDFIFFGDTKIADSAKLGSRYSKSSLRGILIDVFMLSKCSYLTCTFSSQICRMVYELMQTLHPDASTFFHSLDDIYFVGGQNEHQQVAVYPHKGGEDSMDLEVDDIITVAGNHWDGYSKGKNRRNGRTGLYPSYKVKEVYSQVDFPAYPEMNKERPI